MPIMIQIQGSEIVHQEVEAPLDNGEMGKRHILVFHDPLSGIGVQTIFDEEEATVDDDGNLVLLKQKKSDLVVAHAGEMPATPPPGSPGPAQRPPLAGKGRPGR